MEDKHAILIVDDEPEVRDWLACLLQDSGFAVVQAASGQAMREAMQQQAFALLVLDLRLKGEDGLSLAREVRQFFAQLE